MARQHIYTYDFGTVQAGRGLYLNRAADDELLALCEAGHFAYMLTSRQMGKSSLMVQTARRLMEQGAVPVVMDLTKIGVTGVQANAEAWYRGVLVEIESKLEATGHFLETDVYAWWQENEHLTVTQRFVSFFQTVLLKELQQQVVVFIDEIETTLGLEFDTDDFFIAIRSLQTARSEVADLQRLSFVLIGVTTPGELIRDPRRTSFNVGQRVELTDFSFDEVLPLAAGLGVADGEESGVLRWILDWTGGHPYLTQRLCIEVSRREQGYWVEKDVERVVQDTFFGEKQEQEVNFQFVRDMLTKRFPDRVLDLLETYRDIRKGKEVVVDEQSIVQSYLKLSGVVKRQENGLLVRNRIYDSVFDRQWIRDHWPEQSLWKRVKPAILPVVVPSVITVLAMTALAIFAFQENKKTQIALREKETALGEKESALESARRSETIADELRENAEDLLKEKQMALTLAKERLRASQISQQQAEDAQNAEAEQRQRAEKGEADANRNAEVADQQTQLANENATAAVAAAAAERIENLNANLLAESLTIENLIAAGLYFDARIKALRLGHKIRSTNTSELYPDIKLQAVSTLEKVYYANRVLQRNSFTVFTLNRYLERYGIDTHNQLSQIPAIPNRVSLSPDGQTIATASIGHMVRLWGLNGYKLNTFEGDFEDVEYSRRILMGLDDEVTSVSFSPDGQTLATGSMDSTLNLWDLKSGKLKKTLDAPIGTILSMSFSPDGKTVALGDSVAAVRLWNLQSNTIETFEVPYPGSVNILSSVSFSYDGKRLASGGPDGDIKLWDPKNGEIQRTLEIERGEQSYPIFTVKFSPNRDLLAWGDRTGMIKLWDLNSDEIKTIEGHSKAVYTVGFSKDGQTLASASEDGTIKLWNLDGRQLQTLIGHSDAVSNVSFSDDNILVSTSKYGVVKIWDLTPNPRKIQPEKEPDEKVWNVNFNPKNNNILAFSTNDAINLWDLETGKTQKLEDRHHSHSLSSDIKFSPDGKTLAFSSDEALELWNLENGEIRKLGSGEFRGISFSPDGRTLSAGVGDGIEIWDLKSGETIEPPKSNSFGSGDYPSLVSNVSFSSDSKTLAVSGNESNITIVDLDSGRVSRFRTQEEIWSMSFSPNGKMLSLGYLNGIIELWDLNSDEVTILKGHSDLINSVSFDSDGKVLASASEDGTVKLWSLDGRELQTLVGNAGEIFSVSFSSDGKILASANGDGTISLWDFDLENLMSKNCNWLYNYVTNPATPQADRVLCTSGFNDIDKDSDSVISTLEKGYEFVLKILIREEA